MNEKSGCRYFRQFCLRYFAAGFFVFLVLGFGLKAFGQSYFYFENKITPPGKSPLTYYTFLTLANNGSGIARVRYVDPASGEKRLLEVGLLDSTDISQGIQNPDHYLIPDGEPLPILATTIDGFHAPRILFKKEKAGENLYYLPINIEYHLPDGTWISSEMLVNQQKSATGLRDETDLVRVFYNESDDIFNDILYQTGNTGQRGSLPRRKEKLYLISVANTVDKVIGETTKIDLDKVTGTFTKLAADMNMEIQVYKISGPSLSIKAVESALAGIRPTAIDIVVFYYSGHGFRYTDDKSLYPRMSLRLNKDADLGKNNLGLESVSKMLLKKKARVTLCVSDCCNSDVGVTAPLGPDPLVVKDPPGYQPQINAYLVAQLFFPEKPVSILIGSADKYQVAVGNPDLGGYFTHSFTSEMRNVLYGSGSNVTWLSLLANTRAKATRLSLSAPCKGDGPCVNNRRLQSARFEVSK
ncbi:caspase family protein [Dyadobacter luticola]|uniref:Caspase family protein n=1 Tax=Dyadobacter luticola TaxID=1979387 RepID=A0A5R9L5P2_9BACT|nr:caspase family protein [Dyadobacter luticola]TLV03892.1 caspase family protein [Dyadobacter luticola]